MAKHADIHDLAGLLDALELAARDSETVTVGDIIESVGHRTFGPILLLAGVIILAPLLGDIPGVPTMMALLVLLTAGQLLLRRRHFWMPGFLQKRSIRGEKLSTVVGKLRRPARFVDKLLKPRLVLLTAGPGGLALAIICVLIALGIPLMEFIPFSANGAGLALTAFGLALIANDGLLAMIALTSIAATVTLILMSVF